MAELEEALAAGRAHTEEQGQLVRPPSPADPACKQLPAWPPSSPLAAAALRASQCTRQMLCPVRTQGSGSPASRPAVDMVRPKVFNDLLRR
jgi:hypothetical protein